MPQVHIRITRTKELDKVMSFLKQRYPLLSEAEIIKLVLSEKYNSEQQESDLNAKQSWESLKVEGKKIGDRLIREKGLDPKKVTEQQFYDLFLNDHKHD